MLCFLSCTINVSTKVLGKPSDRSDTIVWPDCSVALFEKWPGFRSVKPGNARSNWTGMTNYQADYCHSSSGNSDSTERRPAPSKIKHMIKSWEGGGLLRSVPAGTFLGSASGQGHISHHCQKFGGSNYLWCTSLHKQQHLPKVKPDL